VSEQQLRSSRRAPCYSALVCGEEYTVAYTENLAPCPLLSGHAVSAILWWWTGLVVSISKMCQFDSVECVPSIGYLQFRRELCRNGLLYSLYFNGYTLSNFTLTYTDYTYNILYNITTSEYITSIIYITSLHVSIRLLCIVNYTTLCWSYTLCISIQSICVLSNYKVSRECIKWIKCINIPLYTEVIHWV